MHEQYAGTKAGGQALLGGLDCTVQRNFFGAQIRSFSTKLKAPACMQDFGPDLDDFRAVFIRLLQSSLLPTKGRTCDPPAVMHPSQHATTKFADGKSICMYAHRYRYSSTVDAPPNL